MGRRRRRPCRRRRAMPSGRTCRGRARGSSRCHNPPGGSPARKPLPPIQSRVPIPPRAAIAPARSGAAERVAVGFAGGEDPLLKQLVKEAPVAPATAAEHARSLEAEAAEEIAAEHEAAEDEAASVLLDAAVERARRESLAEKPGAAAPPSPDRPPGPPRSLVGVARESDSCVLALAGGGGQAAPGLGLHGLHLSAPWTKFS